MNGRTDAPESRPPGELADVLRRAAELERTDWEAAIELLVRANRSRRTPDVDAALVGLRQRSFARLVERPGAAGRDVDPGTCPPVGESALPEARLDELDSRSLRAAIVEYGCLLVREAIDAVTVRRLTDGIDTAFAAHDFRAAGDGSTGEEGDALPFAPEERSWWYRPFDFSRIARESGRAWKQGTRRWVRAGGGVLLCDSPRMLHDVLDLYESLGLRSLIGEYLGTRPVLSANKCTLRRVPTSASGGWHQDGAFLGSGIRAMNVWLALTPCGVDAPGLDIVPRRFDGILETGTAGSYFTWAAGDEAVAGAAGGAPVVRPEFRAGDMLLFDDLLMHRTAVDPAMTRERHAIEFWCFAGGAYPPDEIPLVW